MGSNRPMETPTRRTASSQKLVAIVAAVLIAFLVAILLVSIALAAIALLVIAVPTLQRAAAL